MIEYPTSPEPTWSEQNSETFLDLGHYYVPDRELQIEIICSLVPGGEAPFDVLELGCGEGLLARALLERHPQCSVRGLDGSATMLKRARQALASFGERFNAEPFDLAARDWRAPAQKYRAIVSSLAIHHLNHQEKQVLYGDLYAMLATGGALVIADVIQTASPLGNELAANAWDEAVRQRALASDAGPAVFQRFKDEGWNMFRYLDEVDKPSRLFDQLKWLEAAGFKAVDVYWMKAGHAIFGGQKTDQGIQPK